jgi:hypothetical protein
MIDKPDACQSITIDIDRGCASQIWNVLENKLDGKKVEVWWARTNRCALCGCGLNTESGQERCERQRDDEQ